MIFHYRKSAPTVIVKSFYNVKTVLTELIYHVNCSFLNNSRAKENTIVLHKFADIGSHADNDIRNDVGANKVVFSALKIDRFEKVGNLARNVGLSAFSYVFVGNLNRNGIDVIRLAFTRATKTVLKRALSLICMPTPEKI